MRTCHVLWLIQAPGIRRSLENNTEEFTITNVYMHFMSRCLPLVPGFPWLDFAWQTFLLVHLFQLHLFLQLNFLWLCLNTALCEQSGFSFSSDPCGGCQGLHSHRRSWCSISMAFAEMKFFFFCGRFSCQLNRTAVRLLCEQRRTTSHSSTLFAEVIMDAMYYKCAQNLSIFR